MTVPEHHQHRTPGLIARMDQRVADADNAVGLLIEVYNDQPEGCDSHCAFSRVALIMIDDAHEVASPENFEGVINGCGERVAAAIARAAKVEAPLSDCMRMRALANELDWAAQLTEATLFANAATNVRTIANSMQP